MQFKAEIGRRQRAVADKLIGQRGLDRLALLVEQADRVRAFDLELKRPFTATIKQNDRPAWVLVPTASVVCDHRGSEIALTQVESPIRPEIKVIADAHAVGAGQSALKGCR